MTFSKYLVAMGFLSIGTSQPLAARAPSAMPEQKTYLMMCMSEVAGQYWGKGVLYSVFRTKSSYEEVKNLFRKLAQKEVTELVFEPFCSTEKSEESANQFFDDRSILKLKEVRWEESLINSNKLSQMSLHSKPSVTVTQKAPAQASPAPEMAPRISEGPTPNQLKYQRELAEYNNRLAEIEQGKLAAAAKLANDKAAAQRLLEQHRQEMELNRQQVADADRAKRQYERDLAAQQATVERLRTKQDRESLVDWPEAVSVCELNSQNPQSKFGNWKCDGPLQFDYAKLGNGGQIDPKALFNVSNTCGGKVESVRDLGMVSGYHVFGCSFGMHPDPAQRMSPDKAAKFGLAYIPGRNNYRCPKYVSLCRSQ